MRDKSVVLDTCALLWLVKGDRKLSERARLVIEVAPMAYVSAISAWEISLKQRQGALSLPMDARSWFDTAIMKHSLICVPVDADIACRANALPPHHRDPADRFIIATAAGLAAAVVTADEGFKKYDISVID